MVLGMQSRNVLVPSSGAPSWVQAERWPITPRTGVPLPRALLSRGRPELSADPSAMALLHCVPSAPLPTLGCSFSSGSGWKIRRLLLWLLVILCVVEA